MNVRHFLSISTIALLAGLSGASTTLAAPVMAQPVLGNARNVVDVDWHGRGWQHRHHDHGWRGRYGYRPYYGWGPVAGGLAAGTAIGGAIANSRAQALENDAYCSQRFKSYDPRSGTYLGYDGERHPCP